MSDEPKKRGRPRLEVKPAAIALRLPEGLKSLIEDAAQREHLSAQEWIRRALMRALAAPTPGEPRR